MRRCSITDKQKIKHTIAVLGELEKRYEPSLVDAVCVLVDNLVGLRMLLEKIHTPETKEPWPTSSTWKDAITASFRLFSLIRDRKSNFKTPDITMWNREMDKIIRIDKRTLTQIIEVIDWSQQHDFWQNNILSPSKLRKQLDTLELQMSNDHHWQKGKLKRRQNQTGPTEKEKYFKTLETENGNTRTK